MRHGASFVVSAIVLLAGCTEQLTVTSAPDATLRSLTTYTADASPPVTLGGWNGSDYTIAYDINDLGVITGVSDRFSINAVRWETGTALAPASTTPLFVGGPVANGRAINMVGQVAGSIGNNAALWTPSGGGYTLTDIGALPLFAGATFSVAYGMNATGQVVGNYAVPDGADLISKCFLFTPAVPNGTTGTAVEIPGLGGTFCVANDINSSGQIAGMSLESGSPIYHAFVHSGGATIPLQPAADETYGTTINDAGQIAGFHSGPSGVRTAAMWSPTAGGWASAVDLVAPPLAGQSGPVTSMAFDINDAGFVVGYTVDGGNIARAFFWQGGTFTELPGNPGVPMVQPTALTNVLGDRVIVTGADIFDLANNARHGLRWAVTLTPVVSGGCLAQLAQHVADLQAAGALSTGEARSLLAKIEGATRQVDQGKTTPARNLLTALIAEANALRNSGRLSSAQAQLLIDAALCAIAAL